MSEDKGDVAQDDSYDDVDMDNELADLGEMQSLVYTPENGEGWLYSYWGLPKSV